jgi:hypothetical protein
VGFIGLDIHRDFCEVATGTRIHVAQVRKALETYLHVVQSIGGTNLITRRSQGRILPPL